MHLGFLEELKTLASIFQPYLNPVETLISCAGCTPELIEVRRRHKKNDALHQGGNQYLGSQRRRPWLTEEEVCLCGYQSIRRKKALNRLLNK